MATEGNRATYRATLGAAVLLGAGILVLVNWLGARHYRRLDWTSSHLYSLSEKTEKVLESLKTPVTITVFMTEGTPLFTEVQEVLKRYRAKAPSITVETIDPTRNRLRAETLVKEFGVTGASVVFKAGDKKKHVTVEQLAEMDYSRARMGGEPTVKTFKGEQEFTSALLSVTQSRTPKVVFTTGHGERKQDGRGRDGLFGVAETLRRDNCLVEEWGSLGSPTVPAGTDLVVVAGPKSGFTEPESAALRTYLDNGGRALLFLDAEFAPGDPSRMVDLGLTPVLAAYGIHVDDDVVVDPKARVPLMGAETVFASSFRPHPITKLLEGSAVVFPLTRSVGLAEKLPDGVTGTVLAETSAEGWGETDLKNLEVKVEKGDQDVKAPVALAVAVEKGAAVKSGSKTRIAVFGDVDFASNGGFPNAGNSYLVSGAANWALEREALVAIPPKSTDQISVTMSRQDIAQITFVAVVLLPLLAIALGVGIYFKRRR
jgi:ABC-type uncharacterized transport system involved in gliding motility auxiliary subunit